MASPQIASEIVDAFNAALLLSGEDTESLRKSAWQLTALFTRNRSSVLAGLALLHVHAILGDRTAALDVADELWGRRSTMEIDDRLNFATLAIAIAQQDRAAELLDIQANRLTPTTLQSYRTVGVGLTLDTWEPRLVEQFGPSVGGGFEMLLAGLRDVGLLEHMADRQTIVNRICSPFRCGLMPDVGTDGGDGVMLTSWIYVNVDYSERRRVSEELNEKLALFYAACDVDEDTARSLVCEVLLPVTARAPIEEAAALLLA